MKVPVGLKIAGLTLAATAFYTYVGQLVPQSEVHPPEVVEIRADMTPEELVETGRGIARGKGLCMTCHTIGGSGPLRFPDLEGIGRTAEGRIPGMSGLEYLVESLYDPDAYIVDGFAPGMPPVHRPPISLTEGEILAVVAYLQSLGGTVTVTVDTELPRPDRTGVTSSFGRLLEVAERQAATRDRWAAGPSLSSPDGFGSDSVERRPGATGAEAAMKRESYGSHP